MTDQIEVLRFEKNYNEFFEFMDDCQERIYRRFYLLFEEMYLSGFRERSLAVHATIDDVAFDSVFKISPDDTSLLTEVISRYFEEKEEYEICGRILNICSDANL